MESVNETDERSLIISNASRLTSSIHSNTSKGRSPPGPAPPKYPRVAGGVVLLIVILEKTAFYVFASNLYLFLNHKPFDWTSYNAATALLVFTGISYASSLIGGWLTDSVIGRYWTISLSFVFYIAGYAFLPVIANDSDHVTKICFWKESPNCPSNTSLASVNVSHYEIFQKHPCPSNEPCQWLVYVIMTLIGIGSGIFRTIIPPFGADQVRLRKFLFSFSYICLCWSRCRCCLT